MAPAAIGTMVATAVLVLGVAWWLAMVSNNLLTLTGELDTILGAVTGIAGQVSPAPEVVGAIATDVAAMQGALHGLIDLATSGHRAPGDPDEGAPPPPLATAAVAATPARVGDVEMAYQDGPGTPPAVSGRRL